MTQGPDPGVLTFSDSDYINDLDCYWKFTIDCPLSLQPLIVLQFTRFGTQPPDLLSGFYTDFITLSDSPHHNSSSVQVWAGTDPQYAPGPLSIPRDSLWLHFHSDPSISSYAGFQIRYSFSCMASSSSGSEPTADPGLLTCESSSDIVGQGTYVFSEPSLVSRFECGWRLRNPASASPSCVQPQVRAFNHSYAILLKREHASMNLAYLRLQMPVYLLFYTYSYTRVFCLRQNPH
jgi:hypothetical protein